MASASAAAAAAGGAQPPWFQHTIALAELKEQADAQRDSKAKTDAQCRAQSVFVMLAFRHKFVHVDVRHDDENVAQLATHLARTVHDIASRRDERSFAHIVSTDNRLHTKQLSDFARAATVTLLTIVTRQHFGPVFDDAPDCAGMRQRLGVTKEALQEAFRLVRDAYDQAWRTLFEEQPWARVQTERLARHWWDQKPTPATYKAKFNDLCALSAEQFKESVRGSIA